MDSTNEYRGQHPPENILERYVLNEERLDREQRLRVSRHIEECAFCRERVMMFRTVYVAFEQASDGASHQYIRKTHAPIPSSAADARLFTLELRPLHRRSNVSDAAPSVIALAAQDVQRKPRYVVIQTLVTSDDSTFIRVLADTVENVTLLQVVSDNPSAASFVLLQFAGVDDYFVTDGEGQVRIPSPLSAAFTGNGAFIHLPRAHAHLQPENVVRHSMKTSLLETAEGMVELSLASTARDAVQVTFIPKERPEIPRRALLLRRADAEARVFILDENTVRVPLALLEECSDLIVF